jgi:hypothetical protein
MAPGIYGADIEQLRALSKSLGQSGTRLRNVESSVNSLVQSATWKRDDGARFRNERTSTLRPMLNRTSESLQASAPLDESGQLTVRDLREGGQPGPVVRALLPAPA